MPTQGNKLNVTGLRQYLKSIIREFVEKPGKIRVTTEDKEHVVVYHVSVHADDLSTMTGKKYVHTSLSYIMKKATAANISKDAALDNHFGITE